MSWRFLVLLMVPALAGCLTDDLPDRFLESQVTCGHRPTELPFREDHSLEIIEYNIVSDGPFTVRLPVFLSPDGATLQEWADSAWRFSGVEAVQTERGDVLEVSAEDGRRVVLCSLLGASDRGNGCCAERYLDGQWSTVSNETRPPTIDVQVVAGNVSMSVEYWVKSNLCGGEEAYYGGVLAPGWHTLSGTSGIPCE